MLAQLDSGVIDDPGDTEDPAVSAVSTPPQTGALFLNLITANSADVFFFQDRELRYSWLRNPPPPLTVQTLLGKTDDDIFPAEEAARLRAIKTRLLASGEPFSDTLLLHPGGVPNWLQVTYVPTQNPPGEITGIAGYVRDLTEQRRAELALQQQEALYRSLLATLDSPVLTVTADGAIDFLNETAAAHLGAAATISGKRLQDFLPAQISAALVAGVARVFATATPVVVEDRLDAHGVLRWHRVTIQPIRDSAGQMVRALLNITDIHEFKQTQEDLQALNVSLETRMAAQAAEADALYQHAPLGYHTLDGDGCVLMINQTALDWLGYTRDDMIGRPLREFLAAASQARFDMAFPRLLTHGNVSNLELDMVRKNGATLPILMDSATLLDDAGHFRAARSTFHDLTDRKRTQAELQFHASLLAAIAQAVIVTDLAGRIVFWNDAAETIYGWSAEEVLGRAVEEITVPEMSAEQASAIMAALQAGAEWSGEFIVRRRDGTTFWALVLDTPYCDAEGRLAGIVGISTDISARKQAEAALVESEIQNRLLFDEGPDAHMLLDATGRIVRINRAFTALSGLPEAQVLGRTAGELHLLNEETLAMLRVRVAALLATPETLAAAEVIEYMLTDGDGVAKSVESRIFPLQLAGAPHLLVTSRDITVRKQAEDAMRQAADAMARALRLKDEFLATMSHELRTPLSGILTAAEVLRDQYYGPLNERQQRSVHIIETSGRHLLALINDVLDLAKIEADRLELNIERVFVEEVCQASLMFIKELAMKKGVQLTYVNPDPRLTMHADARRLKQMLINLLSNAVKFTPEHGAVQLTVTPDPAAQEVRFAVKDTGIGIAAADITKIFEPFKQSDAAGQHKYEGTGLGLALVKRIAGQHGGSIGVDSAGVPGLGSCFTLTLPFAPASQAAPAADPAGALLAPPESPTQALALPRKVLLVEDNPVNLDMIATYLEHLGFELLLAHDGLAALEVAEAHMPDIILMDIQLPLLNGLEVIRRLRRRPAFATTPIIAVTALAMTADRQRCLAAGATEYMGKPISLAALARMMVQLLAAPPPA